MKKSLLYVIFMMITTAPAIITASSEKQWKSIQDILTEIDQKAVRYQKTVILKKIDDIKKTGSVPAAHHHIKLIDPNKNHLYFCSPETIQSPYSETPVSLSPCTITPNQGAKKIESNKHFTIVNGKKEFPNLHYQAYRSSNATPGESTDCETPSSINNARFSPYPPKTTQNTPTINPKKIIIVNGKPIYQNLRYKD